MLQTLFDSQSSTGFLLLILLLLLAGLVVYVHYKHYYELRVNQHLKTPEKQIHLLTVRTVVCIWGILSILTLSWYMGYYYLREAEQSETTCDMYDTVQYAGVDEAMVKEQLEAVKKGSKSLSMQKEKPNKHVTVTYAVNDRKEYVYVITYDLLREPQKDEQIIIRNRTDSGWTCGEIKADSRKIISMTTGTIKDSCSAQKRSINIYNYTRGKNKNRVDYYDSYTIEKGGIHR